MPELAERSSVGARIFPVLLNVPRTATKRMPQLVGTPSRNPLTILSFGTTSKGINLGKLKKEEDVVGVRHRRREGEVRRQQHAPSRCCVREEVAATFCGAPCLRRNALEVWQEVVQILCLIGH